MTVRRNIKGMTGGLLHALGEKKGARSQKRKKERIEEQECEGSHDLEKKDKSNMQKREQSDKGVQMKEEEGSEEVMERCLQKVEKAHTARQPQAHQAMSVHVCPCSAQKVPKDMYSIGNAQSTHHGSRSAEEKNE